MKKILSIILFFLLPAALLAQNCDIYFPLLDNKGVQYQSFDRRDRLQGTQDMIVKEVKHHPDHIEALIASTYFDNRQNTTSEFEQIVRCKGNEILIDLESMLDRSMFQNFQHMELDITPIEIVFPSQLVVGMELPEASLTMSVSNQGRKMMEMTFTVKNRKVEKIETITTPAGTFECYKITSEIHTETRTMGISRRDVSKSVDYWAKGVGTVRSEHYNSRDRLESYMLLSKVY